MITIKQPLQLNLTAQRNNVSCFGASDGSIRLKAKGSTAPYTYSFSGSGFDTTSYFTNLTAGKYTCVVHDVNNCSYNTSIKLTQPSASCNFSAVNIENAGISGFAKIKIEPNPSKSGFRLYLNGADAQKLIAIRVYNLYGKLVYEIKGTNNYPYHLETHLHQELIWLA